MKNFNSGRMSALFVCSALGVSIPLLAQGPGGYNPPGQGVDLSGNWGPVMHEDSHERGPGPELVNYAGLPINDAARAYGLAWDASRFAVPEHECEAHGVAYTYRGPLESPHQRNARPL